MDDIHTKLKRARALRSECVDEVTPPPAERAAGVLRLLQRIGKDKDNYDLICFCILFLSGQLAVEPAYENEVKALALKLYENHYFNGEAIGLYNEEAVVKAFQLKAQLQRAETGDKNDTK